MGDIVVEVSSIYGLLMRFGIMINYVNRTSNCVIADALR